MIPGACAPLVAKRGRVVLRCEAGSTPPARLSRTDIFTSCPLVGSKSSSRIEEWSDE